MHGRDDRWRRGFGSRNFVHGDRSRLNSTCFRQLYHRGNERVPLRRSGNRPYSVVRNASAGSSVGSDRRKMTTATPLISLVIPCFNEEDVFPRLEQELLSLADGPLSEYRAEFVIVDDGSTDGTWRRISEFAKRDSRVRAFQLSRNFGHQAALTCGYEEAIGDAVVCLDADLQDPPDVIPEMIAQWERGADVVVAVRKVRDGETAFKLWTASLFYKLLQLFADTELPGNAGDFRLMSRRALDAFNRLGERRRYIRGLVAWIGFDVATIEYHRQARFAGRTKYSLRKMISFAADGLLSFSIAPLRLAFGFAVVGAAPFLIYLTYSFAMHIFAHGHFEPGWASIILTIMVFGVLNLFCLGVIGEYVGRLYYEAKGRPIYLLKARLDHTDATGSRKTGSDGDPRKGDHSLKSEG